MTKSKNPCPVCGGHEWQEWCWTEELGGDGDTGRLVELNVGHTSLDLPALDCYRNGINCLIYFDECLTCGTTVT